MAADQEVLRQFMVSLGFQLDQAAMGKFLGSIVNVTKGAKGAGLAIVGVAAAAQAMVASYAASMEKMYYASKRTDSSVQNMMGMESGMRRIGGAAGQAQQALEAMTGAVRMNPGLRGLMNMLVGKDTGKMDQTKAMIELVKRLSSMPHHVGARFAQMFGMDEQTFLMMKQGLPEMEAAMEKHNQLLRQAGIDAEQAAASSKEYMNSLRDLSDKVSALGLKISIELLPRFRETTTEVHRILDALLDIKNIDFSWPSVKGAAKELWKDLSGPGGKEKMKLLRPPVIGSAMDAGEMVYDWAMKKYVPRGSGKGTTVQPAAPPSVPTTPTAAPTQPPPASRASAPVPTASTARAGALFNQLEQQYRLPAGLLDNMWRKESARGRHMLSPAGAKGHFGFMDGTARQYGVRDPNDLAQSATGAAKYMSDLQRKYGGDINKALAAYNWGPGNFDKHGALGKMPRETRNYVDDIGSKIQVHSKTEIHVNGAGDPKAVAENVLSGQERVNGDMTRNLRGAVQ